MSTNAEVLADFQSSLREYYFFTNRAQGPLIEDRARKVRFELFRQFKARAKTPAELRAEIAGLGYKIRRRIDGKLAAEYPHAASVGAVPQVSLADEIKLRVRSLRFLSVSYLMRGWKSGGERGQQGRFNARSRGGATIGSAHVDTAVGKANPFVSLTSLLEGAVEQNERYRIADKALAAQARDMETYLARKHEERLRKIIVGGAKTATRML